MIKQKCKKKKCKGKKGGIIQTVPFYQMNPIKQGCAKSEGGSGCIKGSGNSWKVESNITGKDWNATYGSKTKAQAALKAYHSK